MPEADSEDEYSFTFVAPEDCSVTAAFQPWLASPAPTLKFHCLEFLHSTTRSAGEELCRENGNNLGSRVRGGASERMRGRWDRKPARQQLCAVGRNTGKETALGSKTRDLSVYDCVWVCVHRWCVYARICAWMYPCACLCMCICMSAQVCVCTCSAAFGDGKDH